TWFKKTRIFNLLKPGNFGLKWALICISFERTISSIETVYYSILWLKNQVSDIPLFDDKKTRPKRVL
ncbi:MAG TPA: hypothetical protein VK255_01460, partial [Patescibacteria group bacterium]|nr:hypothetical protein [Patescibacteria group bacterium]